MGSQGRLCQGGAQEPAFSRQAVLGQERQFCGSLGAPSPSVAVPDPREDQEVGKTSLSLTTQPRPGQKHRGENNLVIQETSV